MVMRHTLSRNVNMMLITGVSSGDLNIAEVIRVHKGMSTCTASNYRPILVLEEKCVALFRPGSKLINTTTYLIVN